MGEQQEVIAELGAAGVLAGIRWAHASATRRALESYCEADGHDSAWLGNTRFTLFRDRLDRVFACERYAVSGGDGLDLDVLYAELAEQDLVTMPRLTPGLVRRCDLRGSAGWAYRDRRFLLASGEFGRLGTLPWPQRSLTKQLVAMQRTPGVRQPSLFEDLPRGEPGGVGEALGEALLAADRELDLVTYVVAHSLDPGTGESELVFGRPRLNLGGGTAWHWREDLRTVPLPDTGRLGGGAPVPVDPTEVPDAPVRLRPIQAGLGGRSVLGGRSGLGGEGGPSDAAH
ncbi:MAG TPA: hypothetical protein VKV38_04745 [Trebonia sp.]|nr:hypothetical protein [Trebonia sp.]